MIQSLSTYIQDPEQLTAEVVNELGDLVEDNPSYQTARLLYVYGLFRLQDPRFGEELRKAALFIPDRRVLYHLLEDDKMLMERPASTQVVRKPKSEGADRTQTLIESFLDQMPEQPQPRKQHPVDASVDYMAYLLQQPDAEVMPDATVEIEDEEEELTTVTQQEQEPINDPYFTETLAHIYIKQGKYSKAIEIIRRLSLNYPKKNRYFADQIRFLEKLIINERNQNREK